MQKQTLIEGLKALPGDERLLRHLGSLLENDGNWLQLQQIMLEQLPYLSRSSPLEGHACYLAGKASLELGNLRQALALTGRSLQIQTDKWYYHHIHGRVLGRTGRRMEALQAQQRCAELAPDFPWCWFEIGQLQLAQGETTAAKEAFERSLALQEAQDPGNTALFRRALEGVETQAQLVERQAAASSLWPDRQPPGPNEALAALDELALETEQFRLFLDGLEGVAGG